MTRQNWWLVLALGFVLAGAFGLALFRLDVIAAVPSLDEGVYLLAARVLRQGYPFESLYFDQPPVFVWLLALAFRWSGDSLLTGRGLIVVFSVITLVLLVFLMRYFDEPFAIPFALVLIGTSPLWLFGARTVLSEVPAITCIVASLVLALRFIDTRRRLWLAAAAICFALGVALKPIAAGFGLTIALCLWLGMDGSRRARVVALCWFGLVSLLCLIPAVQLYRMQWFWDEVLGMHVAERQIFYAQVFWGFWVIIRQVTWNAPLFFLALPGFFAAARKNRKLAVSILAGMMLVLFTNLLLPPFEHHYVLLVPFLGIFAGFACVEMLRLGKRLISRGVGGFLNAGRLNYMDWGLLCVCVVLVLLRMPAFISQIKKTFYPSEILMSEQVDFIASHISSDRFVLTDAPLLTFVAGAQIPPCALVSVYADVLPLVADGFERLDACIKAYAVDTIIVTGAYEQSPAVHAWLVRSAVMRDQGPYLHLYRPLPVSERTP